MTAEDFKTILEIAQAIIRLIPHLTTATRYIHTKTMRGKPHSRRHHQTRRKESHNKAAKDNGNEPSRNRTHDKFRQSPDDIFDPGA